MNGPPHLLGEVSNTSKTAQLKELRRFLFKRKFIWVFESAYIDGANDFTVLTKIVIPLIKPTLAVLLLYYGVGTWNNWFSASILIENNNLLPIQNILRAVLLANDQTLNSAAANTNDINTFAETIKYAAIVISTVPILMIYPFLQKYFVKGVMIGSVKE